MKKFVKNFIIVTLITTASILLFACGSKISRINIHGTYRGTGISSYEAVVDAGTITIYSTSFFDKSVYWYGTCEASELDENNRIISKRIETEKRNSWFSFDFGIGKSGVSEKEIYFTEDSLTFVYDMAGMSIHQITLYKDEVKKKYNEYDSNAEKADPNYVEPSKPLPHEIPRGQEVPKEPTTEAPTTAPKEEIIIPSGENYDL